MQLLSRLALVALVVLGLGSLAGCQTTTTKKTTDAGGDKVVYHINDASVARLAINNIKNHLAAEPKTKIQVVTHGKGIDFLLDGAADKDGNPYNISVDELAAKGVQFKVCNNTLNSRKIDPKTVLDVAKIVPSGVAEIGKLQAEQGYVYLKP